MTWTSQIEIYTTKSPYLEEIERLAAKTASEVKKDGKTMIFGYNADRTTDLQAMIEKVMQWKSSSLFINGHIVDRNMGRMMLNCFNYGFGNIAGGPLCLLCPGLANCETRTKKMLEDTLRGKEPQSKGICIGINGQEVLKEIIKKSLEDKES